MAIVNDAVPDMFDVGDARQSSLQNEALAGFLGTQDANALLAGPETGAAGPMTVRPLVEADIPSSIPREVGVDYAPATTGTDLLKGDGSGGTEAAEAGVDYLVPGGLAVEQTQTANTVLAGPTTGAAANPTFRALVADDLGTGITDDTTFLRGDGTWAALSTPDTSNMLTTNTSQTVTGTKTMSGGLSVVAPSDAIVDYSSRTGNAYATGSNSGYYVFIPFNTGNFDYITAVSAWVKTSYQSSSADIYYGIFAMNGTNNGPADTALVQAMQNGPIGSSSTLWTLSTPLSVTPNTTYWLCLGKSDMGAGGTVYTWDAGTPQDGDPVCYATDSNSGRTTSNMTAISSKTIRFIVYNGNSGAANGPLLGVTNSIYGLMPPTGSLIKAESGSTTVFDVRNNGTVSTFGKFGVGLATPTYSLHIAPTSGATAGSTVFIQDATATTGATKVVVKTGAGQSTTNLMELQDKDGNIKASIGSLTAPASVAGNGTAATTALTVTGAAGGASSGTTGQTGGAGASIQLTGGAGGAVAGAGGIGGAGGDITLTPGAGGAGASTNGRTGKVIITIANVPDYANNAAAVAGGLTNGMLYRNGDILMIVHS